MKFLTYKRHQLMYGDARKKITKNIFVSILAIISSIIVSLIIAMIIYHDTSLFYKIVEKIFITPFAIDYLSKTISTIAIFGVGALSFLIAFRSGLFNIGISGQMLFGAIIAIVFAQHLGNVSIGIGQALMLLISICFGAFIAGIIGALKSFLNMNEVVSSIMFNWIVYFVGTWLLTKYVANDGNTTNQLGQNLVLNMSSSNAILNGSWVPLLIIMLVCTVFTIVFLGYTTFGKKIINTGLSPTGAQYAGYSVKTNQILAMVISGALAGILGVMAYCGRDPGAPCNILSRALPQEGFNGISVGLIAMSNPWAVMPISVFFGMIDGSKAEISHLVDPHISDLMFGIIVYGAAIISFFYFVVPYRWYLRVFKGKIYEEHYGEFETSMLRELSEVDDEIYLLKKKYREVYQQIHNHKGKHFDKHRIAINSRQAHKEYHNALNKIYQRHILFKNMERQIFLMNVIGVKKDIFKNKHEQWMREIAKHREMDLNYAQGNYSLEKSGTAKKSFHSVLLVKYRNSKKHIINHYNHKKEAELMHYQTKYKHIAKHYNAHQNMSRKFRKELGVIENRKQGD